MKLNLQEVYGLTIKITLTGTVKYAGINPTLFIIYDSPSASNKIYEDWKYTNYKSGTIAYIQFIYYARTNGQLSVQAQTEQM